MTKIEELLMGIAILSSVFIGVFVALLYVYLDTSGNYIDIKKLFKRKI
jgi:hypothetical protein